MKYVFLRNGQVYYSTFSKLKLITSFFFLLNPAHDPMFMTPFNVRIQYNVHLFIRVYMQTKLKHNNIKKKKK